jgi:peptidyl-prolyl cis-trans isomerase C
MKKIVLAALIASSSAITAIAADPATVNGKPIKQSLVDYIVKDATAQGKQIDDNTRASIVENLIVNELIDQQAQTSGITQSADFVAKQELTLRELRINAYIADYLKKNPVDDQAVRAEYDKLKSQISGKEYKASHILVKTEDEAKSIIAKLGKGGDFAAIAKEQSIDPGTRDNGGDLGWFQPETMVKPFSDAAAQLQKNGYTAEPVKTEFGWHVIKLEDTRDSQPPAFEAIKKEIRTNLQRQQLDKLVGSLREKAIIVRNTDAAK